VCAWERERDRKRGSRFVQKSDGKFVLDFPLPEAVESK